MSVRPERDGLEAFERRYLDPPEHRDQQCTVVQSRPRLRSEDFYENDGDCAA